MSGVELRPLSLGELLDHTFSYYRKHFLLFVGIMALPQVLIVAVNLGLISFRSPRIAAPRPGHPVPIFSPAHILSTLAATLLGVALVMFAYALVYCIALGASSFALSEVHLGRTTTIAGAYRRLRGKVWRLFDVLVSIILRSVGIFALAWAAGAVIFILSITLLSVKGKPNPVVMVLLGLVGFLVLAAGMVFAFIVVLRYSLAVPSLVLEDLRAREAIKRSIFLAKGNLWRIFLTIILMYIINMVGVMVFQGPFFVVLMFAAIKTHTVPLWVQVPMYISGGIGGALSGPFMIIALALHYYDSRVRKEGYDLQLMMSNLDNQPIGGGPSPAPSPATPGA